MYKFHRPKAKFDLYVKLKREKDAAICEGYDLSNFQSGHVTNKFYNFDPPDFESAEVILRRRPVDEQLERIGHMPTNDKYEGFTDSAASGLSQNCALDDFTDENV